MPVQCLLMDFRRRWGNLLCIDAGEVPAHSLICRVVLNLWLSCLLTQTTKGSAHNLCGCLDLGRFSLLWLHSAAWHWRVCWDFRLCFASFVCCEIACAHCFHVMDHFVLICWHAYLAISIFFKSMQTVWLSAWKSLTPGIHLWFLHHVQIHWLRNFSAEWSDWEIQSQDGPTWPFLWTWGLCFCSWFEIVPCIATVYGWLKRWFPCLCLIWDYHQANFV